MKRVFAVIWIAAIILVLYGCTRTYYTMPPAGADGSQSGGTYVVEEPAIDPNVVIGSAAMLGSAYMYKDAMGDYGPGFYPRPWYWWAWPGYWYGPSPYYYGPGPGPRYYHHPRAYPAPRGYYRR